MDIVEFLRARLDEDEDNRSQWHARDCYLVMRGEDMFGDVEPCDCSGPTRVLREVEAKRRILDEHADLDCASIELDSWSRSFTACRRCRDVLSDKRVVAPCPTLRLLALPYDEHPDYQAEWAL